MREFNSLLPYAFLSLTFLLPPIRELSLILLCSPFLSYLSDPLIYTPPYYLSFHPSRQVPPVAFVLGSFLVSVISTIRLVVLL